MVKTSPFLFLLVGLLRLVVVTVNTTGVLAAMVVVEMEPIVIELPVHAQVDAGISFLTLQVLEAVTV